jgi:prepilin-type N-terminal cleavage/methylation domain-containing protein
MLRKSGFTLIELLVTLAILSFVMAMALPAYNAYTSAWTCKSAAQILYCDLLLQRQRAFQLCLPTYIFLNSNGTYSLYELNTTGASLPEFPNQTAQFLPGDFLDLLLLPFALLPAGCNELVTPERSPRNWQFIRTVNLSRDFSRPITFPSGFNFIYFIPKRSAEDAKWKNCTIYAWGDILVACDIETCVIKISSTGEIVMN